MGQRLSAGFGTRAHHQATLDTEAAMPLSPLIVIIGSVFLISLCILLVFALEDKFDEKTASEFEQDVAYGTMLLELRQISGRRTEIRPLRLQYRDVVPLYEGGI
jgi:hypothetical protein